MHFARAEIRSPHSGIKPHKCHKDAHGFAFTKIAFAGVVWIKLPVRGIHGRQNIRAWWMLF